MNHNPMYDFSYINVEVDILDMEETTIRCLHAKNDNDSLIPVLKTKQTSVT